MTFFFFTSIKTILLFLLGWRGGGGRGRWKEGREWVFTSIKGKLKYATDGPVKHIQYRTGAVRDVFVTRIKIWWVETGGFLSRASFRRHG